MTTAELKASVESYKKRLEEKSGKGVIFSEAGPANMGVIDALVAAIESLEARVAELESRN